MMMAMMMMMIVIIVIVLSVEMGAGISFKLDFYHILTLTLSLLADFDDFCFSSLKIQQKATVRDNFMIFYENTQQIILCKSVKKLIRYFIIIKH